MIFSRFFRQILLGIHLISQELLNSRLYTEKNLKKIQIFYVVKMEKNIKKNIKKKNPEKNPKKNPKKNPDFFRIFLDGRS